jgi:hypothetical protein
MMITLRIDGPYPKEGWEDPATGVRYYNNRTVADGFGVVGNLKTHEDAGETVIDQAPDFCLIGRGYIDAHATKDAFGGVWVDIIARNGRVRYQVLDEPAVWEDDPDAELTTRLCMLAYSDWTPEAEFREEPRREIVELPVTEENLNA